MDKQVNVAREIVDSEVKYVKSLELLHFIFEKRLKIHVKVNRPVLSETDISSLFMNLSEIYEMNKAMCDEFVKLRYLGDEALVQNIGDILLKYVPFMKVYNSYVDSYPKALQNLDSFRKKKVFAEFLEINEMCAESDLPSLLILPVQRMPRYVLLMKELLKQSSKDSKLHRRKELKEAVKKLQTAAGHLNMHVKQNQARNKVITIQQDYYNNTIHIIAPHRFVVATGYLKKGLHKSSVPVHKFKHAFPLGKVKVSPADESVVASSPDEAFTLLCDDAHSKPTTFIAGTMFREESGNALMPTVAELESEILLGKASKFSSMASLSSQKQSMIGLDRFEPSRSSNSVSSISNSISVVSPFNSPNTSAASPKIKSNKALRLLGVTSDGRDSQTVHRPSMSASKTLRKNTLIKNMSMVAGSSITSQGNYREDRLQSLSSSSNRSLSSLSQDRVENINNNGFGETFNESFSRNDSPSISVISDDVEITPKPSINVDNFPAKNVNHNPSLSRLSKSSERRKSRPNRPPPVSPIKPKVPQGPPPVTTKTFTLTPDRSNSQDLQNQALPPKPAGRPRPGSYIKQ